MSFVTEHYHDVTSTRREWRQFMTVLAVVFAIVAGVAFWKGLPCAASWLVPVALFGVLALAAPRWLEPFHRSWMLLAGALGWVMTRVILTVLYLLAVLPIGFVARIFGKRFLDVRFRDGRESYWVVRTEAPARNRMEEQF
jgi:hypothetical protein